MTSDHFPTEEPVAPAPPQPAAEAKGPRGFARLLSIIVSPRATFEAVARRTQPWVGVVAVVLSIGLGSALIAHISGPEQMEAALHGPFGDKLQGNEEYLKKIEEAKTPTVGKRLITAVQAGLGGTAAFAIGAVFYWLACMVVGGKAGFKLTLDVVFLCTWVGGGLALLATVPLVLAKGSAMTVGYSLAPLSGLFGAGSDTSSIGYHFLQSFTNFFSIWELFLLAIGFQVVHRLSTGKAWFAAAAPWVLGNGIGLLMYGIFM